MSKLILRNIIKEVLMEIEMAIGGGGWDSNNDITQFHGYPSGYSQFPGLYVDLPEELPNKKEVNKNNQKKILENKKEEVTFKVFQNGNEFYNYISTNGLDGSFDPRFINKRNGGYGTFKYFSYMDYQIEPNNVKFFVIKINDVIVGMAHIRKSAYKENVWFLSYISMDDSYKNKGYASLLSDYMFKWFKDNDITFETSSYSEDGYIKLKPLFKKLSIKYGVDFIDKERL